MEATGGRRAPPPSPPKGFRRIYARGWWRCRQCGRSLLEVDERVHLISEVGWCTEWQQSARRLNKKYFFLSTVKLFVLVSTYHGYTKEINRECEDLECYWQLQIDTSIYDYLQIGDVAPLKVEHSVYFFFRKVLVLLFRKTITITVVKPLPELLIKELIEVGVFTNFEARDVNFKDIYTPRKLPKVPLRATSPDSGELPHFRETWKWAAATLLSAE